MHVSRLIKTSRELLFKTELTGCIVIHYINQKYYIKLFLNIHIHANYSLNFFLGSIYLSGFISPIYKIKR